MKRFYLAGSTCLRKVIAAAAGALAVMAHTSIAVADAVADPPPSLTRYRCYICHSDRETLAGPAFADVAAFYRGRPDAVAKIAADIRRGLKRGGPWHMPPHPEVSPEEAKVMARYIMSLAPPKAPAREVNRP
jgi:cytochrome c551/c552